MPRPPIQAGKLSPFIGSDLKLGRAEQHLTELRAIIEGYKSRKPYTIRLDEEVKGKVIIVRLSVSETVAVDHWALITGDIIHNLRSSLDLLVCSLVRLEDKTADCEWTSFPIFKTADEFSKKGKTKVNRIHPEAFTLIEGLKPYEGGNKLFYQISMLDNIDKHRLLIPAVALPQTYSFRHQGIAVDNTGRVDAQIPIEVAFEDGAPLMRLQAVNCIIHPEMDVDNDVTIKIVFGKTGVADGIPILEFLSNAVDLVDRVLETFYWWWFGKYIHPSLPL